MRQEGTVVFVNEGLESTERRKKHRTNIAGGFTALGSGDADGQGAIEGSLPRATVSSADGKVLEVLLLWRNRFRLRKFRKFRRVVQVHLKKRRTGFISQR